MQHLVKQLGLSAFPEKLCCSHPGSTISRCGTVRFGSMGVGRRSSPAGPRVPSMRVFTSFQELKQAVGTEVGASEWVLVSQERIDKFAEATGDDQWIHVDVERARRELPSGTTIAHGLLTLALLPAFFKTVMRIEGLKSSLNYGSNRVRFMTPVPAGARLRGRIVIMDTFEVPQNGLRVTYRTTVEIAGQNRPACVAETLALHYR